MDFADIRLLYGDQGQGKSVTSVALPIDEYYEKLTGIVSPQGEYLKARSLNDEEREEIEYRKPDVDLEKEPYKYVRVYSGIGNESKVVTLPYDFIVVSPVKIFANFTFYGVPYVHIDGVMIIEYMNSDLFRNAWVVLDESVEVDKQDTMTREGKLTQKFGAQVAKRDVHMIINSQQLTMIQSRFALFATTRIGCSYDGNTYMVSLDVNRNSPVMQSFSYYSPPYWKHYRREELVKVSQGKIDRTLAAMTA